MPSNFNHRLLLVAALFIYHLSELLAQPESESPYSSSESGEIDNPTAWFNSPILLIGLAVFGLVFIYVLVKGRKASAK